MYKQDIPSYLRTTVWGNVLSIVSPDVIVKVIHEVKDPIIAIVDQELLITIQSEVYVRCKYEERLVWN